MNGSSFVARTTVGLNNQNTLVVRPSKTVVVYLAIPHLPSEVQDSYRLIGKEADYDRTLQRSDAVQHDEKYMALLFTEALPAGTYTLYEVFSPETKLPVFIDVPFADLPDYGEAASVPDRREPEKKALGKLPRPKTGDPLLDPGEVSYHLDLEQYLGLQPYGDQQPVNELPGEQTPENVPPDGLIAFMGGGPTTAAPAKAPAKPSPQPTPAAKKDMKPAAILCPPFYLAHRGAVLRTQPFKRQPRRWTPSETGPPDLPQDPDLIPSQAILPNLEVDFNYYPLTDRWVYVFQKRGTAWSWFAEFRVDKKGGYHAVDMEQAKGKERNKRPQPDKDALELLSLPYEENGKKVINGFFLSGTRLTLQSIQKLEKDDLWPLLEYYDLDPDLYASLRKPGPAYRDPKDPVYPEHTGNSFHYDQSRRYYLRVHDHLWYTISLNVVVQQVRDIAIGWLVPAKDLNATTLNQTRQRNEKKLLAETIKQIVDGDPNDKHGLRNEFHPHPLPNYAADGLAVLRQWLKDYQEAQKVVFKNVDDSAHMLVKELRSPVMGFVTDSYLSIWKVDSPGFVEAMPLFLDEFSRCMERIVETFQGVEWIASILTDPSHFVHQYVLEQVPPDGVRYQVGRKSTAALMRIWNEIAIPYLQVHGKASVKAIADAIKNMGLEKEWQAIQARNLILPNTILREKVDFRKSVFKTDIIDVPKHWTEDARQRTPGRISRVLDRLFLVVELINLKIGIESLIGPNGTSEQVWAAVGVIGSSLDAASAFGFILKLEERTLFVIGGVSAFIDAFIAGKQTSDLKRIGDINAAIGSGVVAGGSGLIAIGYAMAFFGGGTAWSGTGIAVGIFGAVLVTLGYIIQFFTADTPLELFVAHSVWGVRYGEDPGVKPWSAGPLESWHEKNADGLTRQITAMANLLAAFTINLLGRDIQIQFGLVHPKTKVDIRLEIVDDAGKPSLNGHSVNLVAELASEKTVVTVTMTPESGKPDPKFADIVSYGMGELLIDQFKLLNHFGVETHETPYDRIMRIRCSARLDYAGDGSAYVPSSGKWADFSTAGRSRNSSSVDL